MCKRFSRTAATAAACSRKTFTVLQSLRMSTVPDDQEMDSRGDVRNPSAFVVKAGAIQIYIYIYNDIIIQIPYRSYRVPFEDFERTFRRDDALYYIIFRRRIHTVHFIGSHYWVPLSRHWLIIRHCRSSKFQDSWRIVEGSRIV